MDTLSNPTLGSERLRVWDLPLRLFHWSLVAAIAIAFLSSEEDGPLSQWHMAAGWVAAVLVAFRLVWGIVGGEHSRFVDFIRPSALGAHLRGLLGGRAEPSLGHNPLGGLSTLVLLAAVATTVATGAIAAGEELHEAIAWALLTLVGIHVAAVLAMSVIGRENLVRAMIDGTKPARRHPGAADARRPRWAASLLAALAILAAILAVRAYDPRAFTPRSVESVEHSGPVTGQAAEEHESED